MNSVLHYLKLFGISDPNEYFSEKELRSIEKYLTFDVEIKNAQNQDVWGNFNEDTLKQTATPFLDNFVLATLEKKGVFPKSIWPENKKFAICLTHDVDRVEFYSPKVFKRNISKRFKVSKSNKEKLKLVFDFLKNTLKQILTLKTAVFIDNLERWSEIERKYGVKSTYFFFSRTDAKEMKLHDCDFLLTDKLKYNDSILNVEEYIKLLDNEGHEIGLHGSFASAHSGTLFSKQKIQLENILKKKIVSTRQHYLHYNHKKTPTIHIQNSIAVDSSMGLNKSSGFRLGTSMPILIETKKGKMLELPLVLMDSAIFGIQNLKIDEAKERALSLINQIEKTGGCFTVNFHIDYVNIPNYTDLYIFILEQASKRNAYFGTCQDIVQATKKCVE